MVHSVSVMRLQDIFTSSSVECSHAIKKLKNIRSMEQLEHKLKCAIYFLSFSNNHWIFVRNFKWNISQMIKIKIIPPSSNIHFPKSSMRFWIKRPLDLIPSRGWGSFQLEKLSIAFMNFSWKSGHIFLQRLKSTVELYSEMFDKSAVLTALKLSVLPSLS